MSMLRLHYAPRTRAMTALWLLEELGEPYDLVSFDLATKRHKEAEFLALNGLGKVPVVELDG
ncbi:MAG: glutathione S-transferase N-terminal domain-containing protein, partial [Myxococcota bacterium]